MSKTTCDITKISPHLTILDRLPKVRGRYSVEVDLSRLTWFQVGGAAQVLFKPADVEDLAFFLKQKPKDIPVFVFGVGSNLLVRDGGIPGVTIRLGKGFTNVAVSGMKIDVGAGVLDRFISMVACEEALKDLEYLCGIPGTIGGALRMNAGCYGSEMKDVLDVAFALDEQGKFHALTNGEMGFTYRHCSVPEDWIFVGARLKARSGNTSIIRRRLQSLLSEREKTQPVSTRTGGSTFANPVGYKCWELIDKVGCRGLRWGGAQVSELHCNFLVNTGGATAAELENLGEEVRKRVLQTSGIHLQWEIKRVGISDVSRGLKEEAA
jgi:UDP-N-acetylmuramate dehydrogenase